MPTEVVVDSSAIAALVTPEEYSDWVSKQLLRYEYFHILDLNYYEVANAIQHKKTNKFNSKDAIETFAKAVEMMNLYAVHTFSEVITDAIVKALDLNITVYDAAFVSLAEKLDIELLTLDGKLAKKLEDTKYYDFLKCPQEKSSLI